MFLPPAFAVSPLHARSGALSASKWQATWRQRIQKLGLVLLLASVFVAFAFPQSAHATTVYNFTNAGATGLSGPNQTAVTNAYQGTTLAGSVTVSSGSTGVQQWTVPTTGRYRFTVVGAHGAAATGATNQRGGRGALITAERQLTQGQVLHIVVGQAGSANANNGGGGGASFVNVDSRTATTNLIVAGGGGGTRTASSANGGDASVNRWGLTTGDFYNRADALANRNNTEDSGMVFGGDTPPNTSGGRGWTNEGFGGVGPASNYGDGGAGWFGNGHRDGISTTTQARSLGTTGVGPARGGEDPDGSSGGFGGGGAGRGSNGGGGGGGYTGGDGGHIAGGGGSYVSGFESSSIGIDTGRSFNRNGTPVHGYVTVQLLQGPPTVTTAVPSSVDVSSASVGGNVTADGGLTVSGRGVVWGTSANPVRGASGVTDVSSGSGTGAFTVALSGLSPGVTYHVRAYAVNSAGTSYGASQSFTTLKLNQTVTFDEVLPSVTFGDEPFTVAPSTDATGLTVSMTALPGDVCEVAGPDGDGVFTVTIVGGGICLLTASQAGNQTYNAATPVERAFTVARAVQTISFPEVNNLTFALTPFELSASTSSALPVTFASDTPDVCTISGANLTTLRQGGCTIVASQAGDDNFLAAATVSRTFDVLRAEQTLTFADAGVRTYGDVPFAPTTVLSSGAGLTPVLSSATPAVCTTDGTSVTLVASGTCVLEAEESGDDRYLPAEPVMFPIQVARRTLTVTGTLAVDGRVYDGTNDAVAADGTVLSLNGVLVEDADDVLLSAVLTFASSQAGTHTVSVSALSVLSGDRAEHYVLSVVGAPTVMATIGPRVLTVSGPTSVTRPFDGTPVVDLPACADFSVSGVLSGDVVSLVCPSVGTAAGMSVGTHLVTPQTPFSLTGTDAANYTFVEPTVSVVITKALAQMWFTTGLVQFVQSDGTGVSLPSATMNPVSVGTLIVHWHDGMPPTVPGRYRVNLTLDSQTHQAAPIATFVSVFAAQTLAPGMPAPTIGPITTSDDDGEPVPPALPPSETAGRKNDQPVVTTVTRPSETDLQVADDASQVVLTLSARAQAQGTPRPLAADTDLVLLAGGVLDVSGSGFKPHTTVEVWMFSDPQLLGVVEADGTGAFTTQFDVPRTARAGEHVIQLNGITGDDLLGSFSVGVLVEVPRSNDDPSPLRHTGGRLFTAPALGPKVLLSGRIVTADVRVTRGVTGDMLAVSHSSGFNARFVPQRTTNAGRVVNTSLVLSRAAHVDGTVDGFAPFTSVHVWLLSEPRLLGRVLTNQNGEAAFRLSLPDDTAFGRHTLQFVATARDGQPVGFAVGVWVVPDAPVFADVTHDMTHGAAVTTLGVYGHVFGFADGTFKPHRTLTRRHAQMMVGRMFDLPDANPTVQGVMTRGEAAVLIASLVTPTTGTPSNGQPFGDVTDVSQQAALAVLYDRGVIAGFTGGTLKPDRPITRAQFSSMLTHAMAMAS